MHRAIRGELRINARLNDYKCVISKELPCLVSCEIAKILLGPAPRTHDRSGFLHVEIYLLSRSASLLAIEDNWLLEFA
jgi:hypothetical protein